MAKTKQRSREEIEKEMLKADNLTTQLWNFSHLSMEVLLDIRDLLAEIRDQLPVEK